MKFSLQNAGLVSDIAIATARARKGAAWLDTWAGPEWDRRVNLNRLDIMSPFHCIVGQLWLQCLLSNEFHTKYSLYVGRGFSCGPWMDSLVLVFRPPAAVRSYKLLTQAWKLVILERRQRRMVDQAWAPAAFAGRPSKQRYRSHERDIVPHAGTRNSPRLRQPVDWPSLWPHGAVPDPDARAGPDLAKRGSGRTNSQCWVTQVPESATSR
jgi:hypothetical protein